MQPRLVGHPSDQVGQIVVIAADLKSLQCGDEGGSESPFDDDFEGLSAQRDPFRTPGTPTGITRRSSIARALGSQPQRSPGRCRRRGTRWVSPMKATWSRCSEGHCSVEMRSEHHPLLSVPGRHPTRVIVKDSRPFTRSPGCHTSVASRSAQWDTWRRSRGRKQIDCGVTCYASPCGGPSGAAPPIGPVTPAAVDSAGGSGWSGQIGAVAPVGRHAPGTPLRVAPARRDRR